MTKKHITFVASAETIGDGKTPDTMDYFLGGRQQWLSLIVPHLQSEGWDVEIVDWEDDNIDWASKKLILIGPMWGYSEKPEKFFKWLEHLEKVNAPIENSVGMMRWNYDKRYLLDLHQYGIQTPKTEIVFPDSVMTLERLYPKIQRVWMVDDLIIKGVVDSAAIGFRKINADNIQDNSEHFEHLKKENGGVVIQPLLPEIEDKGELSFIFFGEDYSHGFLKLPVKGETRVQLFYGGAYFHLRQKEITSSLKLAKEKFRPDMTLTEAEVATSIGQASLIRKQINGLLEEKNIPSPTYMRIDGLPINGSFHVMEIEAIEPYMGFGEAIKTNPKTGVLERYTTAIEQAYKRHN